MSEVNWQITPHKYHSASLSLNDQYYPSSNALPAGSTGAGIECIISIEKNGLIFYETRYKLTKNFGDIERGKALFSLTYDTIKGINLSLTRRGTFNWRNPEYPNGRYVLDVEIELKNRVIYHFEISALTILEEFVQELNIHKVDVVDRINLVEYLKPIKKENKSIYDFIDKNYNDLSKLYHLDNPRLKIEIE